MRTRFPADPARGPALRVAALLAAALLVLAPARAQPRGDTLLPDHEVLAGAHLFSVEERRFLVYLYARLNRPKVAERLADTVLAVNPTDRQTLLVLASMYLEQKDAQATLRIARRFLAAYPGDHQGLYFLATGHHLARDFAESKRLFQELRGQPFPAGLFPYETDLAASAYAAGDWYAAMLAYQRLLRHHDVSEELRADVRRALDGIYREHLPRLDLTAAQVRLDRAEVWRHGAVHGRHLTDRQWLELRYARDEVGLDEAPGLAATRRVREEFAVHHAMIQNGTWRTEAWLGGSGSGALGGGRVQHAFARQRDVALEAAANVRATDSLTLEALDGRQHHVTILLSWLIEADLALVIRLQHRELSVDGEKIGRGQTVELNLDYTLRRQNPRIVVGYRGSIARFEPETIVSPAAALPIADPLGGIVAQQAILASLVSRRINRHGTGLLITDNLAEAWLYRLTGGVDYDFELSTTAWNAALGLSFFPRKSIELNAEAGYNSSASASNAGTAAALLNLSFRYHF